MDVQTFIEQQALYLFVVCAALYVFLRVLFRHSITGIADPLHLYLVYVCFGLALVAYAFSESNSALLYLFYSVILFLIACAAGMRRYNWRVPSRSLAVRQPKVAVRAIQIRVVLTIALLIYLLYLQVIISSGILLNFGPGLVDDRYQIFTGNRFSFYLFSAAQFMPPILIHLGGVVARRRPSRLLTVCILGFCWGVQLLTFSKTALLFPIICYALTITLQRHDRLIKNESWITQLVTLGGISAAGIAIAVFAILASGNGSLQTVLLGIAARLFTSFDALLLLSTVDLSRLPHLSLFQFYFAPILKALGIYSQQYNATNYYLALEIMGLDPDAIGLLPNNNFVAEVFVCFSNWARVPAILIGGFLYGSAYKYFLINRYRNLYCVCLCSLLIATPFGLLIDGQGWFGSVIAMHIIFVVAYVVSIAVVWYARASRRNGAIRNEARHSRDALGHYL